MYEDSPSKIWRTQKEKYTLLGGRCKKCRNICYPASGICPKCKSLNTLTSYKLMPLGKIVSYSLIHVAPYGFENFTPYPIALIKLTEGPVVLSQITDYEDKDLNIGTKVEAVFRKILAANNSGVIRYGLKFRPLHFKSTQPGPVRSSKKTKRV